MKFVSFVALALAVLFVGCGKPDPIVGSWKMTKWETRTPETQWALGDECKQDDLEEYLEDGTWKLYAGTVMCGSGNGLMTGTWKTAAGGTKVIYTYDDYVGEYESTIELLTETTMVITTAAGDLDGTQNRATYSKVAE